VTEKRLGGRTNEGASELPHELHGRHTKEANGSDLLLTCAISMATLGVEGWVIALAKTSAAQIRRPG